MKLLEHHTNSPAQLAKAIGRRLSRAFRAQAQTIDVHFAFLKSFQPVNAAQQRTLASSRRTDDNCHFAALDSEVDPIQNPQRAVILNQSANSYHFWG
jgi:hypothetical protein